MPTALPASADFTGAAVTEGAAKTAYGNQRTFLAERLGEGATAQIEFPVGSVGAPGLAPQGDLDSGIYRIGANNLGIGVNGTKILDIATTGLGITGTLSATGNATVGGSAASTWTGTLGKAIEVGGPGNAVFCYSQTDLELTSNIYYNAGYKFGGTGYGSVYGQAAGVHTWYSSSASGSAGNAATMNTTMSLSVAGALSLPGTLGVTGNVAVNTNKFTVTASTGAVLARGMINASVTSSEGDSIGLFDNTAQNCVTIFNAATTGQSGAATTIGVTKNSSTSRSINAAGTINASGADYAEYETKSAGCGPIAGGDLVGFDAHGLLTITFAESLRFGIKSTNPSYVGGDAWGNEAALGMPIPVKPKPFEPPPYSGMAQPEDPGVVQYPPEPVLILIDPPAAPSAPAQMGLPSGTSAPVSELIALLNSERTSQFEAALQAHETLLDQLEASRQQAIATHTAQHDAWIEACQQRDAEHAERVASYTAALAQYEADQAAYAQEVAAAQGAFDQALARYEADLPVFNAALEAKRQTVDRIAYSGKVPVNVTGAKPGDYILATAAPDGGIAGEAVSAPTFEQYRRAVGRVGRILPDGRAEVAVIVH